MQHDPSALLTRLLVQERAAILSADFEGIAALGADKEALLTELPNQDAAPTVLREIRTDLDRNQALLSAAIAGVKAARSRLDALHQVRDGLSVYNPDGQLKTVSVSTGGLEKKA